MTRDELETELETLLIGTPKMSDVMSAVDAYVTAERERIAQAIEAEAQNSISDPEYGGMCVAAQVSRDAKT